MILRLEIWNFVWGFVWSIHMLEKKLGMIREKNCNLEHSNWHWQFIFFSCDELHLHHDLHHPLPTDPHDNQHQTLHICSDTNIHLFGRDNRNYQQDKTQHAFYVPVNFVVLIINIIINVNERNHKFFTIFQVESIFFGFFDKYQWYGLCLGPSNNLGGHI